VSASMRRHHHVASAFWLVIGVCIAVHSYGLGIGSFRQPGPGLIFFLAALLFIALAAVDLALNIFKNHGKGAASEGRPLWRGLRWQKVALVLAGLCAYVYLFNITGFVLSTFLLMVFLFKGVEPTRWRTAIASSLITMAVCYLMFVIWLEVPFPKGPLGF